MREHDWRQRGNHRRDQRSQGAERQRRAEFCTPGDYHSARLDGFYGDEHQTQVTYLYQQTVQRSLIHHRARKSRGSFLFLSNGHIVEPL
jgi:hypothetical protein